MTHEFKKNIGHDIVDKLQSVQYFYEGSKNILVSILTIPSLSINDGMFDKFVDKYMNDYVIYELYKLEIEANYLHDLKAALPYKEYTWLVDYTTTNLAVSVDLTDDEYNKIKEIIKNYGYEEE